MEQRVRPSLSHEYDATNFAAFRDAKRYFIVRNADKIAGAAAAPRRTVVILGTGRSGTTMTAGILIQLGFEFGDRINGRLGDVDMSEVFDRMRASPLRWRMLTLRRDFGKLMRARMKKWGRFAFKSPDLPPYFPLLSGALENPVYIIPNRNTFETSFGFSHNTKGMWAKSFILASLVQTILSFIAAGTRRPVLLFSYEQAVKRPEAFVEMLADFLSLDLDTETKARMVRYIDPSTGYHPVARLRGHIDRVDATRIDGWISDILHPERSVEIAVSAGPREIFRGPADLMRDDARARGFHATGACGFSVAFDPALSPGEQDALTVSAPETGHMFWRPGWQTIP